MGTWGPGNLDSDGALDDLCERSDALVKQLLTRLKDPTSAEADEYEYDALWVDFEWVLALERAGALSHGVLPEAAEVRALAETWLAAWEAYIPGLDPKPEYKVNRRATMATCFERLARACERATPTVHAMPSRRYADAPGAIDWFCRVLGFERHLVVPDDGGGIRHAQLTLGTAMIMVGSQRDDDWGRLTQTQGGAAGSAYLYVRDVDERYAQAVAAGADVVVENTEQPHGGKMWAVRDPEGNVWAIGSYNPWT